MKTWKRVLCTILAIAMMATVLSACGGDSGKKDPDPVNAKTGSYEDMVAYLTAKGYIAEGTTPVDMNTTPGYSTTDHTGGEVIPVWADKAEDYGGLWLLWWDLENQTEAYERYQSMMMNSGTVVYMGGACVLEGATLNGAFAIYCAEGYEKADAVTADFKALPNT